MSYDGGTFSYDDIGNPISYYNGLRYTFAWTNGIQLARASVSGYVLTFTYNDSGIRTSKTVNGVTHEYHLAGTQILSEEWIDANGVQHLIVYHYDANGLPIGMSYRNSDYTHYECDTFLYVKNLQGDIIKVLDAYGNLLVSYTYDAWGNPTSTTYSNGGASTAVIYNPFRYRGYYYDSELGFYYLNSRYYDPAIGRFINADGLVSTGQGLLGYNMFAYCNNNPVNFIDPTGEEGITIAILSKALMAVLVVAVVAAVCMTIMPDLVEDVATVVEGIGNDIGDVVDAFSDTAVLPRPRINNRVKEKVKEKVKAEENEATTQIANPKVNYWSAEIINGLVKPITPLTYSEAMVWAAAGNDLLCINHKAALGIVKFYPSRIHDEAHGSYSDGYLNHYHLSKAHSNHIWYYGGQ